MALTFHQLALQRYFRQSVHRFVSALAHNSSPTIMEPTQLFVEIVKFLDEELRREITLYERQTQGYNFILDMLIEAHVTKKEGFGETLLSDLTRTFYEA